MISNELTYIYYGYYPSDLKKKSNKLVICFCDICGIMKISQMGRSHLLCYKCGHTNFHSEETKRKIGMAHKGKKTLKEANEKNRVAHLKENLSEETRRRMSISSMGNKNGLWKGGISLEIYPQKFNKSFKKTIRIKYNNCDFFSGLHKSIINKNKELSVHHIDYNKNNCNLNNFIPLSGIHHNYTNFNRWFWEKLINNTQEIDKWYYD